MTDALDTIVHVGPRNRITGVRPPGFANGCEIANCAHTYDWRAPDGSAENRHRIAPEFDRTPLRVALATEYRSEAHMVAYALLDRDGATLERQPRVTKDAPPWLREQGYEIVLTSLLADWDTPGHVPWTHDERAKLDALWASGVGPLATCGLYLSPKGARLVQPLRTPLPVERGEAVLRAWLEELVAVGVDPSVRQVKDWTHLMRVPHHRRSGGTIVRSPFIDMGRMVYVEPAEPPAPPPRVAKARRVAVVTGGGLRVRAPLEALPPPGVVPAGWGMVADAIGAAIRDTVRNDWRRCYLALAGALCERGCPPGSVADVVARAHLVDPAWAVLLEDRTTIARTTVARFEGDGAITGYPTLRAEFPSVADALDTHTVTRPEAHVLRQLAAPAPVPVPVAQAVALIEQSMRAARDVVLIEAPPGTGKTQAVVRVAADLPPIPDGVDALPGQCMAVSTPTHKLSKQTAAQAQRSLRLFSPVSHVDADGAATCVYIDSARALASGGQSIRWEFCDGRGKRPCEHAATCAARDGMEGDPRANLAVGVHGLMRALAEHAGVAGTLVVDEPDEVLSCERLERDDFEAVGRHRTSFVWSFVAAMQPALHALERWVADLGAEDAETATPLTDAVRAGAPFVAEGVLRAVGIDPLAPHDELGAGVLAAARTAREYIRDNGTPGTLRGSAPLQRGASERARSQPTFAADLGRASRVYHLLGSALRCGLPFTLRIDTRSGERAVTLVGPNENMQLALGHSGPVVILDANAALHAPAVERMLRGDRPTELVRIAVRDGAPIARTVIATRGATRSAWLPRGVPDWPAILPALRQVVAWLREDPATRSAGLFAAKEIETAIAFTLRPEAPETAKLVAASKVSRKALEAARALIAPVLAAWDGELLTGHFGGLEGLNDFAACDATVTIGDPRPNLGQEIDKAAYLGLDAEGRLDALAAAELQQAHGRLRVIHRTRPGRQLHVGSVVPSGWAGLHVDVRPMPSGRPAAAAAMTAAEFASLRAASGQSQRAFAKALGLTHPTVRRYESGAFPIPADVARAAMALAGVEHKPLSEELSVQGFVFHPPAGGPGPDPDPATGVCVPPTGGAARVLPLPAPVAAGATLARPRAVANDTLRLASGDTTERPFR